MGLPLLALLDDLGSSRCWVPMEDGQSVKGATIGLEGLAGIAVFLGDDTRDDEAICQVAVPGARMAAVVPIAGMVMRISVRQDHHSSGELSVPYSNSYSSEGAEGVQPRRCVAGKYV
jgi:hypothetical protein